MTSANMHDTVLNFLTYYIHIVRYLIVKWDDKGQRVGSRSGGTICPSKFGQAKLLDSRPTDDWRCRQQPKTLLSRWSVYRFASYAAPALEEIYPRTRSQVFGQIFLPPENRARGGYDCIWTLKKSIFEFEISEKVEKSRISKKLNQKTLKRKNR